MAQGRNVRLRVPIIPNAAPWPLPAQPPRIPIVALCSAKRHVLLAVGRLSAEKNYQVLIDVFSQLAQEHRDWGLVILSEGPECPALKSQVQAASLDGRVFLPGWAGNVGEWYERAERYYDKLSPRWISQCACRGHGARCAGGQFRLRHRRRDIIRHEVDGLLAQPGDVAALKSALDRLMADAALRLQFASRAVEAREIFSMERIAGMWEELLSEVRL